MRKQRISFAPAPNHTVETTTLYASDQDVFLFLVEDTHSTKAARLADSSPYYYSSGFYAWNSEVGPKTLGIASLYLRAVCQNRNLWHRNFEKITIRHSKFAAQRFAHEATRERIVARTFFVKLRIYVFMAR